MPRVTVSGLPGSGTSTLCRGLTQETGWRYINAGQVFRQLAEESGLSLAEYGRRAEEDGAIDRQLDARMVEMGEAADEGCLLEGRLTGWMMHRRGLKALKVWVHADIKTRARRVAERESQPLPEAMTGILEREESERLRYARHHRIDLADTSIYDLVLDSDHHTPEQLRDEVLRATGWL